MLSYFLQRKLFKGVRISSHFIIGRQQPIRTKLSPEAAWISSVNHHLFLSFALHSHHPLKMKMKLLSHVRLFATPWTVACQAPPSMGFSKHEHWRGLPFPSLGDLPTTPWPGAKPGWGEWCMMARKLESHV